MDPTSLANRSWLFLKSTDQWASTGGVVCSVQLDGQSFASNNTVAAVVNDGDGTPTLQITRKTASGSYAVGSLITSSDSDFGTAIQNGDYIIITAVALNGKMGSMKIVFKK
ncbi:hypothetical protein [Desulfosporosinus sp. SB140]|uniref:hypothetical protein n=1 Tax=Desulfosporosinus paludis TaxID=3115649 RepID=UPI0038908A90